MANQSGQAYAFMAMTPVLPGRESDLEARLADWGSGTASPLARLGTTHFARLLVLRELVYQGEPQVRDTLHSAYLVFVTNFDGDLEDYLRSMLDRLAVEVEQVWGLCVGFPGVVDGDAFVGYLMHNQLDTTFFVSAYPHATVADVMSGLDIRRRVADLAVAGQGLDPASLMARWRAEFAGVTR